MDFLELCQTLARESGISNSGPSSVGGQIGEFVSVIDWVQQAYIDIQNRHRWRWLKREFTLETVQGQRAYTFSEAMDGSAITRFAAWYLNDLRDPPKIYRTSTGVGGQTFLSWVEVEDFRVVYEIGTQNTNEAQPLNITVDDQDRILLGPLPNDVYTVTGRYIRGPQVLSEDEDIPEMPSQYHRLIVLYALEHYAFKYVAQEALERSRLQGRRMLRQLEATQAPRIGLCGPLA